MNGLVGFARLRYAVIEALRADADAERFVIAYGNEQAVHDVIAAASVIAFNFSSLEEAEATIKACVSAAAA